MKLTEDQTRQLQEQSKIAAWTKFLATTASKNTVHIHKGQMFAKQLEQLAELVERSKTNYISSIFDEFNIKQAKVNMETGELTEIVLKDA